MKPIISALASRIAPNDITLIGETHILMQHRLMISGILKSLSPTLLPQVFLELDSSNQASIPYVTQMNLDPSNSFRFFEDPAKEKAFVSKMDYYRANPNDLNARHTYYNAKAAEPYNFLAGMMGNPFSYQAMLRAAAPDTRTVVAIDRLPEGVTSISPEGMIQRNLHMAEKIAAQLKTGGKAVAIVGGDHLKSFREKGTDIPSLQAVLKQEHGIHADSILFAEYRGNMVKRHEPEIHKAYPRINRLFQENAYQIRTGTFTSDHIPNAIVLFPQGELRSVDDMRPKYLPNYESMTLAEEFDAEKAQWNHACIQSDMPELTI